MGGGDEEICECARDAFRRSLLNNLQANKTRQIKLTSTIDLKTACSVPLAVLRGADALRVFFGKRFRVASGWLDCDMTFLNMRQKIHDNGVMSKRWFMWLEQKTINCCAKSGKRKGADESRQMSSYEYMNMYGLF